MKPATALLRLGLALLLATGCAGAPVEGLPMPIDAGAVVPDAGVHADAGAVVPDAGSTEGTDAGVEPDAGVELDAGVFVPPDAGLALDGGDGTDLGDSVPNSAPTCTSGVTWFLGNLGTEVMNPGQACMACHATHNGAPRYTFAGTVYPSTHEPDNCNGAGSGWQVVITDAAGKHITLTPNLVGSFHSTEAFTPPYTAQVLANGRTREMLDPQTSGDCNSCHTQSGTSGAPGRIVAP